MRKTGGSPLARSDRDPIAPRALVPDDILVLPRPLRTQHHIPCAASHRPRPPGTTPSTRCTVCDRESTAPRRGHAPRHRPRRLPSSLGVAGLPEHGQVLPSSSVARPVI